MKLSVAGKGGVGKTFIAATLSRLFARDGYNVLAVDADSNINLASSLGIPREVAERMVPLSENSRLIEERTGISPGSSYGAIFRMTPTVNDIVDKFGVAGPDGVKLLVMGTVKAADKGCMCPAHALLRVLMQHLLIQRRDIVIMDMEAGLEHLGRGTARRMDSMLVVVEPGMKSIETLRRIKRLASELEIREVLAVGNKIGGEDERRFIEDRMRELNIPVAAYIPYDQKIVDADIKGKSPLDIDERSPAILSILKLKEFLKERYKL
ncbi:AAA family ATPase [Candidatus Bathyarchaeota archaeon]|nr:AAA family ATPase [Candidatus Bathyarchaeota archaeon]